MKRSDLHTQIVGWLKVALPLSALGILSTLFLLARTIDPNNAIPIAEVDVEDRLREPRMTAPEYTGTTSDGASILLTATEARQDDGGSASAKGIVGKMVMPNGGEITLTAAKGNIDDANGVIDLAGAVRITTSTGYVAETETMSAKLDRTSMQSSGSVKATGPIGSITADQLSVAIQGESSAEAYLVVFNGHVKLIYLPPT